MSALMNNKKGLIIKIIATIITILSVLAYSQHFIDRIAFGSIICITLVIFFITTKKRVE